ncbi:MAG: TonB-dependent receptor [Woeseiaceae bacterium]|nr:TonB-dependent receptor [Woeseiaceae bacterium]
MSRTMIAMLALLTAPLSLGQEADAESAAGTAVVPQSTTPNADSTVIYDADFFAQYNLVTANDMLERIPGLDLNNIGAALGDRGLGTGGNLLINGQRVAGKSNSTKGQLSRIPANEVQRIEIIRDTSGALNVRGASEVINIVLAAAQSRSTTTLKLVNRLNHDDTFETGGSVGWANQTGNLTALVNLDLRPNYENRDYREVRLNPNGEQLGTLFETNIRDQDVFTFSTNLGYKSERHRTQLNLQYREGSYPRPIRRDFVDFTDVSAIKSVEKELVDNEQSNWEVGGDYEFSFDSGSRLSLLLLANNKIRDSVRERFEADPAAEPLSKELFIDSMLERGEFIVQGNYNFPLTSNQSMRVGLERADTQVDSSLLLGSASGTEPPSENYGGLPPVPSSSNLGMRVQEIRYEGFLFHNWVLSEHSSLESSVVYEISEISQSGTVNKVRDFQYWRPSMDYRYNITEAFQIRATVQRYVEQLPFSLFATTTNEEDRDRDILAGNPEIEPETSWYYDVEVEYRLPDDGGVLSSKFTYAEIDNHIGRINATTDPSEPLSAMGNVGPARTWAWSNQASLRLTPLNLPSAVVTATLDLYDSEITDPFLGTKQRIDERGRAKLEFRHDMAEHGFSYGFDYNYPFLGGYYDIDIVTITRNDPPNRLNAFVQKVWFDDWTFRLESDNTLDASRCRTRQRFDGSTIDGSLALIQDSCSSRYRRLTLSVQTNF